jgi:hypothetical protein
LSTAAAFVGYLLLTAFLVIAGSPVGWAPLVAFVVGTPVVAALCARRTALSAAEVGAYMFAFVLLGWPVLGFAALFVRYWITGQRSGTDGTASAR